MPDQFSDYYTDFLNGTYDCVDRIVLNAYYRMGQAPAGFRTWWRRLKGSDDDLDKTHLMRMAGRFSRRLRAYAKAHRIPLIDCNKGERKHLIAEPYIPKDPNFTSVFLVLISRPGGMLPFRMCNAPLREKSSISRRKNPIPM